MTIDEKVAVFREKYRQATDQQVEGYRQALLAEEANPPVMELPQPEPELMLPPLPAAEPLPAADLRHELKQILLGTYGFSLRLSEATLERIRTEDLNESELLALIITG
jgi:hypothetical protein